MTLKCADELSGRDECYCTFRAAGGSSDGQIAHRLRANENSLLRLFRRDRRVFEGLFIAAIAALLWSVWEFTFIVRCAESPRCQCHPTLGSLAITQTRFHPQDNSYANGTLLFP